MNEVFIENTHDEHAYERADILVEAGEASGPHSVTDSELFRVKACRFFDVITKEDVKEMNKPELVTLGQRLGVENVTDDKTKKDIYGLIGLE